MSRGSDLSPISLLELTGSHAQGYLAHDWLAVEEGCPLGRFPIDKPGDTNAKPAVSERRIGSNLMSGEASWILRPTGMLKF